MYSGARPQLSSRRRNASGGRTPCGVFRRRTILRTVPIFSRTETLRGLESAGANANTEHTDMGQLSAERSRRLRGDLAAIRR